MDGDNLPTDPTDHSTLKGRASGRGALMARAHLLPQTCCPPAMRRREQKTDASGLRSSNRPQQACCERIKQPKRCQGPSGPCRGTCWLRVCAESPASPESSMWLWDANTAIVMGIGSCPRPWVHVEWARRDQRRGEDILGHAGGEHVGAKLGNAGTTERRTRHNAAQSHQ